jgi:hypothetical protein
MYEKPQLNRVGEAQDVILGSTGFGNDLDLTYVSASDEFAWDYDQSE